MKVKLTDDEIVLYLSACTRPKVVECVAGATARIALRGDGVSGGAAKMITEAVAEAAASGLLIYRCSSIGSCGVCGKSAGYALRKRASRAGRKGSPMYDRPLYMSGVELRDSFVTMKGHVSIGGCKECVDAALPRIVDLVTAAELRWFPDHLDFDADVKREDHYACKKCEWSGRESYVGRSRAMMGNGTYPSTCPDCGAKNEPFGKRHISIVAGRHSVVKSGAVLREIDP